MTIGNYIGKPNFGKKVNLTLKEQNADGNMVSDNKKIYDVVLSLNNFLQEKNKRYGNSAIEPLKVFSKNIANDSILTRIDDKLSRIKNSEELRKNDIVDLAGYLVLLCVEQGWDDLKDLID